MWWVYAIALSYLGGWGSLGRRWGLGDSWRVVAGWVGVGFSWSVV